MNSIQEPIQKKRESISIGDELEFSKHKPYASALTACFRRKSSYSIDQKRKRGERFHRKDRGAKHNSLTYGMQLTLRCRKIELWDLFFKELNV